MDVMEAEQLGALASNWREARQSGDDAAMHAFEDELRARMTEDEIGAAEGLDPKTGERSPAETDRLRAELGIMWSNAAARLD